MSQDVKQLRVKIFDELSKIVDPEINTTITELELIDEVDISEESVKVDLHLTSPFCPAVFGFKICQDIHELPLICYLFPYLLCLQCIYKPEPVLVDRQMMYP